MAKIENEQGTPEEQNPSAQSFESLISPRESEGSQERYPLSAKKPRRNPWLVALTFLIAIALVIFGILGYIGLQEKNHRETVQEEKVKQSELKAAAIEAADNPFSVLIGEVEAPGEDTVPVLTAENKITVGATVLSLKDGVLAPPVNGCNLVAITDICLAARGKYSDGDFEVLAVKDISRTRFLDNPSEFIELKSPQGMIEASLAIDMGDAEGPRRVGAITANGTTGFIVIFPKGTAPERVKEVLKAATVI